MKAKEQAEQYLKDPTTETMAVILKDYMNEMVRLIQVRHAKSDDAGISILRELDQKFQTFARIVREKAPDGVLVVSADGFDRLFSTTMEGRPEIVRWWKAARMAPTKNVSELRAESQSRLTNRRETIDDLRYS